MLVFGLIREDAFKIASVAAHDWSMMQDGDIHLLDLQRAKMRKNKVESHRLLSQQSLFDKSQNFYTMSAVIDFASVAAALALHPHRMRPALREAAGIKGDHTIGFPQLLDHLSDQHRKQRAVIPWRGADELLDDQALNIDEGGDLLSILAVQVGQEAYQIEVQMTFAGLGLKPMLI